MSENRALLETPRNILYTHTASWIGGGNKVLLRLFASMARERYRPVCILPEPGPMESELQKLGIEFRIMDIRPNASGRIRAGIKAVRLAALMKNFRIEIVHANDPFTYRTASIAAKLTGAARICHVHHPDQSAESIAWAFATKPSVVLTPTEYVRQKVCDWIDQPNARFVRVIGNPIDTQWFRPPENRSNVRMRLGISTLGPHITIIGALAPHKGHDCFLRAADIVRRKRPDAMFHIVGSETSGDKAWAQELRKLVQELQLERSVKFWGFASDQIAREILQASDLFLLPTKMEGFGLVVAEALACGVPVLVSAIRPLDEIVIDGESGFLIPSDAHELFAARALDILGNHGLHGRLAESGRKRVFDNFGEHVFCRKVTDSYEEIRRDMVVRMPVR